MTLLLSFAALLPRLLLGFCIVHFIWGAIDGRSLLVKLFLPAVIGFGISSLFGFLWIWFGLPLVVYAILESALAIILTGWVIFKDRHAFRFQPLTDRSNFIWSILLALGIFLFALDLALYSLQYPHGRPDAWINWNVAARFIYLGGADWQATFLRQWDHPDYPLFVALTNAITWVFIGNTSTWGPIAFHFTISLFTAGSLFAFINHFRDFKMAALAAVLFVSLPFVVDQGMRQYADLLLAYIILSAGGLTLLYLQTRESRLAILAGVLIGLGGWTKNEGLAAIVGFTFVWILITLRTERSAFKSYMIGLAFPLLVTVLFKLFLAPSNDLLSAQGSPFDKILDVQRYTVILREAGLMLWRLGDTPIPMIGLIILAALLLGRSADRIAGTWMFGVLIAFQLAAYFGIFLLTPNDLTWHLNTSLDRLYLHVFPLAFLWLFLWLRSPQGSSSKES